jgi:surface polysaccharide O-acyltransferase-like enzyme
MRHFEGCRIIGTMSSFSPLPRLPSIESYRVFAALIIVAIHANFFGHLQVMNGGYGFVIDLPVALTWWLAVPYFFLVAGYFFGQRVQRGEDSIRLWVESSRSLLRVFLIWLLVYSVLPRHWIALVSEHGIWQTVAATATQSWKVVVHDPLGVLINGLWPMGHLWFLLILVMGLGGIALINKSGLEHQLPLILAGGYVITLTLGILPVALLQAYPPRWYLFGILFTLLGWWLTRLPPVSARIGLGLLAFGFVLAVAEGVLVKVLFHRPVLQIYGGSVLMAVGVFLFTLAKPRLGDGTMLPTLARFTLGVYVSHIFVEHTLAPLHEQLPHVLVIWHVAYVFLVYALSVLLTWGLSSLPGLRWTVLRRPAPMPHVRRLDTPLVSRPRRSA